MTRENRNWVNLGEICVQIGNSIFFTLSKALKQKTRLSEFIFKKHKIGFDVGALVNLFD